MKSVHRFSLTVLAIFFIIISPGGIPPVNENGPHTRIQYTLDSIVEANGLPGLNLCLITGHGQSEIYSSGYAHMETGIALTPDHILFSGSIGKTYAAAVIMQLVDEGKINLSDRFLDFFADSVWLAELPNIQSITIRMLLQHTSGLPEYVMKPEIWSDLNKDPDRVWTYRERMSYISGDEPVHEAGKGWGYSDTGYVLLGMLIERITGKHYYDVVQDRLLTPLNLTDTYPSLKRNMHNLPQGYSRLPAFFQIPEKVVEDGIYCFNPQLEWTGGGFACTTPDLAKWARAYYRGSLFSDSLFQQVIAPNEEGYQIQPGLSYGMGSFIFETRHGTAVGHSGFVPGFLSIFAHYPELEISAALQINCDYLSRSLALIDILNLVLQYRIE